MISRYDNNVAIYNWSDCDSSTVSGRLSVAIRDKDDLKLYSKLMSGCGFLFQLC